MLPSTTAVTLNSMLPRPHFLAAKDTAVIGRPNGRGSGWKVAGRHVHVLLSCSEMTACIPGSTMLTSNRKRYSLEKAFARKGVRSKKRSLEWSSYPRKNIVWSWRFSLLKLIYLFSKHFPTYAYVI